jgi:hypothetical protein
VLGVEACHNPLTLPTTNLPRTLTLFFLCQSFHTVNITLTTQGNWARGHLGCGSCFSCHRQIGLILNALEGKVGTSSWDYTALQLNCWQGKPTGQTRTELSVCYKHRTKNHLPSWLQALGLTNHRTASSCCIAGTLSSIYHLRAWPAPLSPPHQNNYYIPPSVPTRGLEPDWSALHSVLRAVKKHPKTCIAVS